MTATLASLSAITGAAGILVAIFVARRAAYERVLKALDYVTSSQAATARHTFGTTAIALESPDGLSVGDERLTVEQLFALLWVARQVYAVWRSLGPEVPWRGPHQLLKDSLADWLRYMVDAPSDESVSRLERVAAAIGARLDETDRLPVTRLAKEWGLI